MALSPHAVDILSTWFGPLDDPTYPQSLGSLWFGKSEAVDRDLTERFASLLDRALTGALNDWATSARGGLALIILLDQFSRNIHRGTPKMYAGDDLAVDLVLQGMETNAAASLHVQEQVFFYMPLMHAESVPLQRLCERKFRALKEAAEGTAMASGLANNHKFAVDHMVIVDRFGRFPHRNEILGRPNSEEETAFLKTPGSSF